MSHMIRKIQEEDIDAVVEFAVDAWVPVFRSFRKLLGDKLFEYQCPNWRSEQAKVVASNCRNTDKFTTFVAVVENKPVGFVCVILKKESRIGEIELLAVDPNHQGQNIGTELSLHALDFMKKNGMEYAEVGTGGDPGHAPARRTYEKAGFTGLPLVRYYKMLDES